MVEEIHTTKEEYEEKIRIFKKNEEAVYDILALYKYLQEEDTNALIEVILVEKVIKDLEDPEINVSYKANTIREFYDKTKIYPLANDIYLDGYKELRANFKESYKNGYCFYSLQELPFEKEFNLVIEFAKNTTFRNDWLYEFLISDIPLETRLEMFADILNNNYFYQIKDFIINKEYSRLNRTSKDKQKEKIQELLVAFEDSKYKSKFLETMLKNSNFKLINYLQENLFDFNNIMFIDVLNNRRLTSISGMISKYDNDKEIDNFKLFYESESYKDIPEDIRDNDDYMIIENLSLMEINRFIKLSNFTLTRKKLDLIIKRLRTNYEKNSNNYIVVNKLKYIKNQIINAIIHKAKNKQEYKEMLEFVKYFTENTDFEKEKVEKLTKQKELENERTNFSTMLYNMNEYLQENEPGRKLIKNIDFKKNN